MSIASYFDAPLFPANADWTLWAIVLGCFAFWTAAYVGIIVKGFREKTYCMPIAAFCGNILWEFVFAFVYPNSYLLVRLGNCLWLLVDLVILVTIVRYARREFADTPLLERWLFVWMAAGIALGTYVLLRFTEVYDDTLGYTSGWLQALLMSFLFVALLLRRGGVEGQSMLIAIGMVFGNVFAWLWVAHFPEEPRLDPGLNDTYAVATVGMNLFYAVLLYLRYRELGVDPWTRSALLGPPRASATR